MSDNNIVDIMNSENDKYIQNILRKYIYLSQVPDEERDENICYEYLLRKRVLSLYDIPANVLTLNMLGLYYEIVEDVYLEDVPITDILKDIKPFIDKQKETEKQKRSLVRRIIKSENKANKALAKREKKKQNDTSDEIIKQFIINMKDNQKS